MTKSDKRTAHGKKKINEATIKKFELAKNYLEIHQHNPDVDKVIGDIIKMKHTVLKQAEKSGSYQHCNDQLQNKTCTGKCCTVFAQQGISYQDFYIALRLISQNQRDELEQCFSKQAYGINCLLQTKSGCILDNIENRPAICANHYCLDSDQGKDFHYFKYMKGIYIRDKFDEMGTIFQSN